MEQKFPLEKKRLLILVTILGVLFLLIIGRLFKLMIIDAVKDSSRGRSYNVYERGEILDANYKKLAVSLKVYSLFCNAQEIEDVSNSDIEKISRVLEIKKKDLEKIFTSKKRFVWIKRQINYNTIKEIIDLKIKGIYYLHEFKRFYPNNRLCAHVLGITGIDNIGLEGLELYYDKYLSSGIDSQGRKKKANLVLSIDKNIQYIVENELRKTVNKTRAKSGSVIIMEPSTGYIIAMATIPDFNPNKFAQFSQRIRQNQAILNIFEPGSIFKIFSSAAIYGEKVIKENELINCPGYIIIGGEKISCWDSHGKLSFHDIIKKSCNTGIITGILRVSRFDFYNYLLNFGIGNYTGIDLPGEAKGFLKKPKGMGLFSHASIALGQEVGTTAIQLITAACSIFNDGKLMEPKIVKAVITEDGAIYKEFKPLVIRQAISPSVARKIRRDMVGVVEEDGTGTKARIKGYSIAGKTGTGQVYSKRLKAYDRNKVNSSFIGFFPAENTRYGILVTIHEPKTEEKMGGKIAAPLFKRIVEKMISYKAIPNKEIIVTPSGEDIFQSTSQYLKAVKTGLLPDLSGKNMREVINILKPYKVKMNLIGSGVSFKQDPEPGTAIQENKLVSVWFREP